ncbi:hypothetical protein S7711_09618 [Stachybotrys chartarum IBT 7711]|uniref:Extracellular matrix protein n=1 Tax=Stachybotrys chartarum (strain CBS 109288 / IBT 7711) TaxID=1280523 RepID=A0A084AJY7_STACB|nr:hypothetical protein S7711_09618 [Stachybotrys chartarum IBT 7711]KFA46652.1 hypothetical protein S40293_09621 [Stachybotrys chartarum IBT 40293]KFA71756.1 hypothetical protein S40288_09768 [Stachybotrys chartarum IBT 40288]
MKYTVAALSAVVAIATAQSTTPAFLNSAFDVEEGEPFTLTFSGCDSGCTITLQNGEPENLQDVEVLTTEATGGEAVITLDALPEDQYNFKITDNETGVENYSDTFPLGSLPAESSAASTSAAESTTAAVSSTVVVTSTSISVTTVTSATVSSETTETSMSDASTTTSEESTSTTAAETTTATTEVPDSGATHLGSPLALVAGAVAVMVYLN